MDNDTQKIIEAVDSEVSRQLLALASLEPMSAQEFEDELSVSLTTIYRHTEQLVEREFLAEGTEISPDGSRYSTFETAVRGIEFTISRGEFRVEVKRRDDIIDRFSRIWRSLEGGST